MSKNNPTSDDVHIPRHVAIIPDGNRRWAKLRGKKPWYGHEVAAQNLEDMVLRASELGITYLTLWGSSRENLDKRPLLEKKALLEIYAKQFTQLMNSKEVEKGKVRVRVIGRWRETFPSALKSILEKGIEKTQGNDTLHLTICLAYSGDDEMLLATQALVDDYANGKEVGDVTPAKLKSRLMTHDLPPVDYLIRTGGEPHLSVGFMMWEIANAQLFFSDLLCPDFDADQFEKAIEEFAARARRHGA